MRCVRFSQDGRYLAVSFMDGTTQIHDVEERANQWYVHTTLRYIRLLILRHLSDLYSDQSSQSCIHSVCFSPNSDYLATAGVDGQIRVSYRFFAMFSESRLAMLYMSIFDTIFDTLQLRVHQLTLYTH